MGDPIVCFGEILLRLAPPGQQLLVQAQMELEVIIMEILETTMVEVAQEVLEMDLEPMVLEGILE